MNVFDDLIKNRSKIHNFIKNFRNFSTRFFIIFNIEPNVYGKDD